MRITVLADDLSGAAECAAPFAASGVPTSLRLLSADDSPGAGTSEHRTAAFASRDRGIEVVDTDTRELPADEAAHRIGGLIAHMRHPGEVPRIILKKADSLLRGNIVAEVEPLLELTGGFAVCAMALPGLDRITRNGVLLASGRPLRETALWKAEPGPAPESLSSVLPRSGTHRRIALDAGLRTELVGARAAGRLLIADVASQNELEALAREVAALTDDGPPLLLIGTGALAAAVAGQVGARRRSSSDTGQGWHDPSLAPFAPERPHPLFVLGTAAPGLDDQIGRLSTHGVAELRLGAGSESDEQTGHALARALADGPALLRIAPDLALDPRRSRGLADRLARLAAGTGPRDLFLSGGETARRTLDRLGITGLVPLSQVEHGTVLSRAVRGGASRHPARIVTRPGSFGEPESLIRVLRVLRGRGPGFAADSRENRPGTGAGPVSPHVSTRPATRKGDEMTPPVIAVTMGDGAGIGPEVVVGALLAPEVAEISRPVVIGDAVRLRRAAALLGVPAEVVAIERVEDAEFAPARINVIDLGLLPEELPWGEVSPLAGDAAYHYVRVASELAVAGKVQAICTAPLNKEALHAGGHLYPGHTELLAQLTGTAEVSMMLSTEKLKVIHVTTHIGLVDAVARIEPGLVERTIRRGDEALRRAGIGAPRIGVCAINPHAGENGLFGYGEEAEKIEPALQRVRADGIDAAGPLPADTAFFLAGRGDYDLIVAMYHDQGHGPVKVLGIEAGVNITVGLPVIRTSVDHGTAFDIAGTGRADHASMIEAMRQAAALAAQ